MRQIISFNNKNVVLPAPWVPSGPANDEIWYTSTDGNIVTPYRASSLPTIVSNTYSDGKGVIKFATDVTSIGDWAFNSCTFTSVTIPNSVTSIGYSAFRNCTDLKSISYTGTIAQYNAITKDGRWHDGIFGLKVVHCTDGDAPI